MFRSRIQYSLHIIKYLHGQVDPVNAEGIAERLKPSIHHIEQIARVLAANKILNGKRGPSGGYTLNMDVIAVTPMNKLAKMFDIPDDKFITKKIRHMTICEVLEL